MNDTQEVIDLTASPPPLTYILINSDEDIDIQTPTVLSPPEKKKLRRRRRNKSGNATPDTSNTTREPSPEQEENEVQINGSKTRGEDRDSSKSSNKRKRDTEHDVSNFRESHPDPSAASTSTTRRQRREGKERRKSNSRRSQSPDRKTQQNGESDASSPVKAQSSDRRKSKTRRSRSPQPSSTKLGHEGTEDSNPLFYVDVAPAQLPPASKFPLPPSSPITSEMEAEKSKLLLPAHVSVVGDMAVEILPPADDENEDFIEYLDYDNSPNVERYFDIVSSEKQVSVKIICKNCKAENEHKTQDCPVIICLTCGVHNEHITRSCPISKVCFTCGMKGHINATCPNQRAIRTNQMNPLESCNRCGSRLHMTNECPTCWRLYEYLADDDRTIILQNREQNSHLPLGQGGEVYIADDECCYNCGGVGHWGDDCNEIPHIHDRPREGSAFSSHNTFSGPFYDPAEAPKVSTRRRPRHYQAPDDPPIDVGLKGRRKEAERMRNRAAEQEADPDDWFASRSHGSGRRHGDRPPPAPRQSNRVAFGLSVKGASSREPQRSERGRNLLDRLGGDLSGHEGTQSWREGHRDRSMSQRGDTAATRDQLLESRLHPRRDHGSDNRPRYRGSYR